MFKYSSKQSRWGCRTRISADKDEVSINEYLHSTSNVRRLKQVRSLIKLSPSQTSNGLRSATTTGSTAPAGYAPHIEMTEDVLAHLTLHGVIPESPRSFEAQALRIFEPHASAESCALEERSRRSSAFSFPVSPALNPAAQPRIASFIQSNSSDVAESWDAVSTVSKFGTTLLRPMSGRMRASSPGGGVQSVLRRNSSRSTQLDLISLHRKPSSPVLPSILDGTPLAKKQIPPSANDCSTAPPSPATPTNSQILEDKLSLWEKMFRALLLAADHQDCRIPNKLLVTLQDEILFVLKERGITPRFLLQARLSQADRRMSTPSPCSVVDKAEVDRLMKKCVPIENVLMESHMKFFQCEEENDLNEPLKPETSTEKIDKFVKELHSGPLAGRSTVGCPLKSVATFPVMMYGTGTFDPSLKIEDGGTKWRTRCECICPVFVTVLLESLAPDLSDVVKALYVKLGTFFSLILSDWRCHRIRLFNSSAKKYQTLMKSISTISQGEMKREGWSEFTFGPEDAIRWKAIREGVLLSFLSGTADVSIDKVLALVYDGDTHQNWIPFLNETQRYLGLAPFLFSFGYGISLPWPLNRRELVILGMATDSLDISAINAIQMWGTHVPDAATTLFGVPLTKCSPNAVSLELPILSFFLKPLSPTKTQVTMIAAVDIKVNFVPMALQAYLARHLATKMFKNVQQICRDFDKSGYPKVIEENKELFENILENMPAAVEAQRKDRRIV